MDAVYSNIFLFLDQLAYLGLCSKLHQDYVQTLRSQNSTPTHKMQHQVLKNIYMLGLSLLHLSQKCVLRINRISLK